MEDTWVVLLGLPTSCKLVLLWLRQRGGSLAELLGCHKARYAPSLRLAKTPKIKRHSANKRAQMVLEIIGNSDNGPLL